MKKNREETTQKIIDAVGRLLRKDGFRRIGINSAAEEAGVDKVLIYRYFGGLDGLIEAFANHEQILAETPAEPMRKTSAPERPEDKLTSFLLHELDTLHRQPLAREIMAWDLFEDNAATRKLTDQSDDRMMSSLYSMMAQFDPPEGIDLMAIMALLRAAVNYLYVRTRTRAEFFGIDLSSEQGWNRLERAIEQIVHRVIA
ncbi:TetR/AcrR family transcriptional regulator [bacterium]|nr:TetR/AcrR family transcriptional regulator [bacterium]